MNTLPISAVCIFCEDVRNEANGGETFIGVLPDGVSVEALPGIINRLTTHTRITFPPAQAPKSLRSSLRIERVGITLYDSDIESAVIERAARESLEQETPLATVINRVVMGDLNIPEPCRLLSCLNIDGEEYIVGTLRIEIADPQSSPGTTG
jgi:hypothetical protein